jgi:hypothetical protein
MGASIFFTASGRNVNYDEEHLTGKIIFELFLLSKYLVSSCHESQNIKPYVTSVGIYDYFIL